MSATDSASETAGSIRSAEERQAPPSRRGLHWAIGLLVAGIVLAVYVPYVPHAAYVYDDWDIAYRPEVHPGFWATYASWFPKFSIRPLAPLLFSATAIVFGWWLPGYVVVNGLCWIAAVAIAWHVLHRHFGTRFGVVFALLALLPSMSSTLLFNAGMQIVGTFSLLAWAVSLWLLDRFVRDSSRWGSLVASYLVILLSMMIYELMVPLLIINALYPWAVQRAGATGFWPERKLDYLARYIVPLGLVVATIAVSQKVVTPLFSDEFSRLRLSPANAAASVASWMIAVFVQFPALLAEGMLRWRTAWESPATLLALLVLFPLLIGCLRRLADPVASDAAHRSASALTLITLLSFVSGSALYFFTGNGAVVWGFGNRGMTPTWMALALLLGMLAQRWASSRLVAVAIGLLILLNTLSFVIQRNNYMQIGVLQQEVVAAAIDATEQHEIPRGSYLAAHVPVFLTNNYNGEYVFRSQRDFGLAVEWFGGGRISGATVMNRGEISEYVLSIDDEEVCFARQPEPVSIPYDHLFYFEYDQDTHESRLVAVRDAEHFHELIEYLGQTEVNRPREPLVKPLIDQLRQSVKAVVR